MTSDRMRIIDEKLTAADVALRESAARVARRTKLVTRLEALNLADRQLAFDLINRRRGLRAARHALAHSVPVVSEQLDGATI